MNVCYFQQRPIKMLGDKPKLKKTSHLNFKKTSKLLLNFSKYLEPIEVSIYKNSLPILLTFVAQSYFL